MRWSADGPPELRGIIEAISPPELGGLVFVKTRAAEMSAEMSAEVSAEVSAEMSAEVSQRAECPRVPPPVHVSLCRLSLPSLPARDRDLPGISIPPFPRSRSPRD